MANFLCTLHKDEVNTNAFFYTSYTNVFPEKTMMTLKNMVHFRAFLDKEAGESYNFSQMTEERCGK
jgi:hypothetical protein